MHDPMMVSLLRAPLACHCGRYCPRCRRAGAAQDDRQLLQSIDALTFALERQIGRLNAEREELLQKARFDFVGLGFQERADSVLAYIFQLQRLAGEIAPRLVAEGKLAEADALLRKIVDDAETVSPVRDTADDLDKLTEETKKELGDVLADLVSLLKWGTLAAIVLKGISLFR